MELNCENTAPQKPWFVFSQGVKLLQSNSESVDYTPRFLW